MCFRLKRLVFKDNKLFVKNGFICFDVNVKILLVKDDLVLVLCVIRVLFVCDSVVDIEIFL